jgi:hypothetical protein
MTDEALVSVFIPPLVYMLAQHERQKGSPLTEDEVLAIRGKSAVMMMRQSMSKQMAQKRGYSDIDPKNCWQEWQQARQNL